MKTGLEVREQRWLKLRAVERIAEVVGGVQFKNGVREELKKIAACQIRHQQHLTLSLSLEKGFDVLPEAIRGPSQAAAKKPVAE